MIDENEAPEGYKAVESKHSLTCGGCCFIDDDCTAFECNASERKDKSYVIFVKKSSQKTFRELSSEIQTLQKQLNVLYNERRKVCEHDFKPSQVAGDLMNCHKCGEVQADPDF